VQQFKVDMGKVEASEKEKSVGSTDGKEIEIEDETPEKEKEQGKTIGNKERSKS
jgi:hypothetical protein